MDDGMIKMEDGTELSRGCALYMWIGFAVVIAIVCLFQIEKKKTRQTYPSFTVGIVTGKSSGRRGRKYLDYSYKVDSITYTGSVPIAFCREVPDSCCKVGAKVRVRYVADDPSNSDLVRDSLVDQLSKDTIAAEPQTTRFGKKGKYFLLNSRVAKVVSYSFLDVHDYEFDSTDRGQLLKIMPNYDQYLWKKDPHPKVILNRSQALKLLGIINDPNTYELSRAECDFPRNCFVLYNESNEIVGWYEICFECGVISSIPEFSTSRRGGISEGGEKELRGFCKSVGITVR